MFVKKWSKQMTLLLKSFIWSSNLFLGIKLKHVKKAQLSTSNFHDHKQLLQVNIQIQQFFKKPLK
ncbi:unnamed protein product [Paramecium sonneborni]|uniref:Uncharacterized protein n=1 Tax=Paramecium sonneborni TaxID=65129 RepID=A0A8S1NHG3_9CILI|nr:unnamed protein product [Paramecium sonneborni]